METLILATELWARNPHAYIRECVNVGQVDVVWDFPLQAGRMIQRDHARWVQRFTSLPFRSMMVGKKYASLLTNEHLNPEHPAAVFPVWWYGESIEHLEKLMAVNIATDDRFMHGLPYKQAKPRDRPRKGQEHRVLVAGLPGTQTKLGAGFISLLGDIQRSYPDAIMHVHGNIPSSYRWKFGPGFRAVEANLRERASYGEVMLPSGLSVPNTDLTADHLEWVRLIGGYTPHDLMISNKLCEFNILACRWASRNWNISEIQEEFRRVKQSDVETFINASTRPKPEPPALTTSRPRGRPPKNPTLKLSADKFFCDTCSLARSCHLYRSGSVCTLPESDARELAELFTSRDANQILDGLGKLLASDVDRMASGQEQEAAEGVINKDVTKISDGVFKKAVELAKLVDPKLRGSLIQQNIGPGAGATALVGSGGITTPMAKASEIVEELEAAGVPRDDITPLMIQNCIDGKGEEVLAEFRSRSIPSLKAIEEAIEVKEATTDG